MNRQVREKELLSLSNTREGCSRITDLWKKVKGIPEGTDTLDSIGTPVRHEMIPEILAHEFPNG